MENEKNTTQENDQEQPVPDTVPSTEGLESSQTQLDSSGLVSAEATADEAHPDTTQSEQATEGTSEAPPNTGPSEPFTEETSEPPLDTAQSEQPTEGASEPPPDTAQSEQLTEGASEPPPDTARSEQPTDGDEPQTTSQEGAVKADSGEDPLDAELSADGLTPLPEPNVTGGDGGASRALGRESSEMDITTVGDMQPTPQEEPTVIDEIQVRQTNDDDKPKEEETNELTAQRSAMKKGSDSSKPVKFIQFADNEPITDANTEQPDKEFLEETTEEMKEMKEKPIVEEEIDNLHALSLVWGFGMTPTLSVINLTSIDQTKLFYACAHIGILYDYVSHRQHLLQAHRNAISCCAASLNRRWLVTADKGSSNTLVVWDTHSAMPVRTILDPHPNDGTAAVAISHDNKFVASISAGRPQTLAIWNWLDESISVIVAARLDIHHYEQNWLSFKPNDAFQLLSNSDSQVLFFEWNKAKKTIAYYAPVVDDSMVSRAIGKFTKTEFMQGNSEQKALTATTTGNLVVWEMMEEVIIKTEGLKKVTVPPVNPANRRVTKILKVTDKCVDVLTTVNGYIVTGDTSGIIKFLENDLKMKNWFYDLNIGSIKSISFDFEPKFTYEPPETNMGGQKYTRDATIPARLFPVPNFIASSSTGLIAKFNSSTSDTKVLLKMQDSRVHAIAAHPKEPMLVICGYNGLIQMVDYRRKHVIYSTVLDLTPGVAVRCCTFDPFGDLLALGLTNGEVVLLMSSSLVPATEQPLVSSAAAILHIAFSHNGFFLATADQQYTTTVFANIATGNPPEEKWVYFGRYRAHYKPIQDLLFGVNVDTGRPRLLTLGVDRYLVEYDLDNSKEDDLCLLRRDRIEQSSIPMCVAWYPTLTKEHFILTANSQFKLKLYNETTKKCRYTYLGPTYGSPLQKIVPLPAVTEDAKSSSHRHLVYITRDMLGLSIMPLDGNPHKSVSLLAHPRQIIDFCISYDGQHIFTCGGPDPVVHMWRVNVLPLDAQAQVAGGDTIEPFYRLLEGGRQGPFVREMEDFFYYLQIGNQGVDHMSLRTVGDTIPLEEVPNLMRALGFYPTEQEIENMVDEVKYSKCIESPDCTCVDRINLDDFVRLYINHRPAFGLDPEQILWAFRTLTAGGAPGDELEGLTRGELFALVQNKGEHMTEYELGDVLVSLLGYNVEDECGEKADLDSEAISQLIDDSLPEVMSSGHFVGHLLGLAAQPVGQDGPPVPPGKTEMGTTSMALGRRATDQRGLTTEQTLLSEMTIPELHNSGTMTD